ncbi:MAG: PQQ-binding-like beta-propeller repeat protein [Thermomicrobiales bacterium]|nr:PQQ-binding-like beta-propeller repeat protein [Thermomicrobiales bacterium]
MDTKASLTTLTISRRTTLQVALAAMMAGRFLGTPRSGSAQSTATDTWNWGGNPGHTGELPGPGLDLEGALGELWRIPRDEFGDGYYYGYDEREIAGYLNGAIYTWSGNSLWARTLEEGQFLWGLSPTRRTMPGTPEASPEAAGEEPRFSKAIAIDGELLLVTLNNGHLWALDAMTGDLRWDFDSGSEYIDVPTVVDHVAFCATSSGLMAIELGGEPAVRWTAEVNSSLLGVADGYVYIATSGAAGHEIRALTVEDGSEYWRTSPGVLGEIRVSLGVSYGGIVVESYDFETSRYNLIVVDRDGQVSWTADRSGYYAWAVGDTITTLALGQSEYDNHWIISRFAENGNSNWELGVDASRWSNPSSDYPVLCAGSAYALLRDSYQDKTLLAIIDPAEGEVVGAWDSNAIPLFAADGVMLARDRETGDIVAIGTVPAVLQTGGRATVIEDATVRGAPSDTAIERTQVTAGALVDVTGEGETANGTEWVPVYEHDTGQNGWLPVDVLAGQDGSVRFTRINPYEFGQFTSYPRFSAGTKAEITEKIDLRGAPSESSAKKSTLDAGTMVTVTSPPTETDEGEWCPITVDDTGESGWVPTAVLKLAPRS